MGILSKIVQAGKAIIGQTSNLGKSLMPKTFTLNAGEAVTKSYSTSKSPKTMTFSDLVRSTPAYSSPAARVVNIATGQPVTTISSSSSKPKQSTITQGRSKRSDLVRTQVMTSLPGSPVIPGDSLGLSTPLAGAGLGLTGGDYTNYTTGGDNMGWYNSLDENLAGLLPGGEKVDWGQAAIGAGLLAGGYGIGTALKGQAGFNSLQRLFGGGKSQRKVYRRRIGVKRSDIKRLKAMSRDLHRLDKVVNAAHIADIKFSRTTKARG